MDNDELTDDALTGGFRLLQRKKGHRYSLDDVLTAYRALQAVAAPPTRCLDLGCGIGSVLLMVAYKLPEAHVTGVEAQDVSFDLVQRNVARNGVQGRVRLVHGDFRQAGVVPEGPFDLITGTPPYQPLGQGTVSPDSQRAHARVELRGGVEAYLEAAAPRLAPEGTFVVCGDARRPDRVERAAQALGLHIHAVCEAVPTLRKGPLFSVWTLRWVPATKVAREIFLTRNTDGTRSQAYLDVRTFFDLSQTEGEAPSPLLRPRQPHATGELT